MKQSVIDTGLSQRVLLTNGHRNALRWGYELQQGSPAHMSVVRIAKKAGVPAHVVGSACNVNGWDDPPAWMELGQFHRLLEVLLDV